MKRVDSDFQFYTASSSKVPGKAPHLNFIQEESNPREMESYFDEPRSPSQYATEPTAELFYVPGNGRIAQGDIRLRSRGPVPRSRSVEDDRTYRGSYRKEIDRGNEPHWNFSDRNKGAALPTEQNQASYKRGEGRNFSFEEEIRDRIEHLDQERRRDTNNFFTSQRAIAATVRRLEDKVDRLADEVNPSKRRKLDDTPADSGTAATSLSSHSSSTKN